MLRKTAMFVLMVTIVFAVASCSEDSAGPKDKDAPEVSITNAWDAAKAGGVTRDGIVEITVDAYDDAGIAQIELFVNNKLYDSVTSAPYVLEWDMTDLPDGSTNTIYVRAVDVSGNAAKSSAVTVVKGATSPPVATMTSPADGSVIAQGDALVLTGTASDSEDGALSDSQIIWSSSLQGVLGQGTSLTYRGLVIGTHHITMTAVDSNGVTDEKMVTVTVNANSLPYATIEKGTYYIGDPLFRRKTVRFSKGIYVSKTEMTIQEFLELWAIADGTNTKARAWADKRNNKLFNLTKNTGLYPRVFEYSGKSNDPIVADYAEYPACFITYIEACVACNAKSEKDGLQPAYIYLDNNKNPITDYTKMRGMSFDKSANGWRLPTEAEYEVAARAGLIGAKFPWGDYGPGGMCNSMSDPTPTLMLDLYNGRGVTPVESYEPNRFGLYNIVGNVAEMCTDMFVGTSPSGVDPVAILEVKNPRYIAKGGAWYGFGASMQIAMRTITVPYSDKEKDSYGSGVGFRVVRNAD